MMLPIWTLLCVALASVSASALWRNTLTWPAQNAWVDVRRGKVCRSAVVYALCNFTFCNAMLLTFLYGSGGLAMAEETLPTSWTLALETPGGPLEFGLRLEKNGQEWAALITNGPERIPVEVQVSAEQITLLMDHYDSKIDLGKDKSTGLFAGSWTKRRGKDTVASVRCEAVPSVARMFASPEGFLGRWAVQFADSDDPAVGVFDRFGEANEVVGTFLTTTGDYRTLHGGVMDGCLVLSCFDGAHAFLFRARLGVDGKLQGDFWSGNWYHEAWTAERNPNATLPDGFTQTVVTDSTLPAGNVFPDLDGQKRSLSDDEFRGKATLIEIFGSWCPNCHDEAAYLKELRGKYGPRGLKVLGLAFELTGDFERDANQVRLYLERFDVDYPVLVAGVSDKKLASEQFPILDRIRSFPTTLFLDERGTIRAVYTGFSGPATGHEHQVLRKRFETLIESLLDE